MPPPAALIFADAATAMRLVAAALLRRHTLRHVYTPSMLLPLALPRCFPLIVFTPITFLPDDAVTRDIVLPAPFIQHAAMIFFAPLPLISHYATMLMPRDATMPPPVKMPHAAGYTPCDAFAILLRCFAFSRRHYALLRC